MDNRSKRNCPGCESANCRFVGPKNGFDIFLCADCRSLYASKLPEIEETLNYDEYYSATNLEVPEFIMKRVDEIISGFESYKKTNRLLDIGFGAGTILQVASRKGWDVSGQEVSSPAVEQARVQGFEAFCGNLSEAKYPDAYFDVITCSEILEHVPNPQEILLEVARILRPGGLFWATTPSARGISYRLMGTEWSVLSPPEHTQLYSKKGIIRMLHKAGFSRATVKTYGTNPNEIINYYRKHSNAPEREEGLGFDRVQSSYNLNEKLSSSPIRQTIKGILNNSLNLFEIGDSLKIFANK